ncbi:putative protein OS=Streptomyces tendae OX=1932 GN=GUR47_29245 PE=4 SV=1 [Streptomyces tendae]
MSPARGPASGPLREVIDGLRALWRSPSRRSGTRCPTTAPREVRGADAPRPATRRPYPGGGRLSPEVLRAGGRTVGTTQGAALMRGEPQRRFTRLSAAGGWWSPVDVRRQPVPRRRHGCIWRQELRQFRADERNTALAEGPDTRSGPAGTSWEKGSALASSQLAADTRHLADSCSVRRTTRRARRIASWWPSLLRRGTDVSDVVTASLSAPDLAAGTARGAVPRPGRARGSAVAVSLVEDDRGGCRPARGPDSAPLRTCAPGRAGHGPPPTSGPGPCPPARTRSSPGTPCRPRLLGPESAPCETAAPVRPEAETPVPPEAEQRGRLSGLFGRLWRRDA